MDRVEKMLGRMKASKLYRCVDWDPEGKAKDLVDKFNSASRSETMTRTGEYLGKLFAHMGKECYIEPPFYCDYGTNIHVGDYFYANTGLIVLDQCDVIIGDHAFLGPRVNIYCACHPIDAMIRNTGVELGKPVTIGDNVWIGGNTVINPGVNGKINASRSGVIFCSKNMTGDATARNTAAYIMDFPCLPGFLPPVWKSLGTGNTLPC